MKIIPLADSGIRPGCLGHPKSKKIQGNTMELAGNIMENAGKYNGNTVEFDPLVAGDTRAYARSMPRGTFGGEYHLLPKLTPELTPRSSQAAQTPPNL